MTFKSLLDDWAAEQEPTRTSETYEIHLATKDAARVHALADLFPGDPTLDLAYPWLR